MKRTAADIDAIIADVQGARKRVWAERRLRTSQAVQELFRATAAATVTLRELRDAVAEREGYDAATVPADATA
jgi:hypothetical protein